MSFDVHHIRRQFPFFNREKIVYLDTAATAQKPAVVLDAVRESSEEAGNAHRGLHVIAERTTDAYEHARSAVASFIHAQHADEIIFVRNATEAINLVARSWGARLKPGDGVLLSVLEHHSNIVPWLQLKAEKNIDVAWVDIDDDGNLNMDECEQKLKSGLIKLVAVTGQSNVLGVRPDLQAIIKHAHAAGAKVLVDAAQLIAHAPVDVQELNCDFLAFSGHKLYGPAGIGVLYAKRDILKDMPPFLGGGMMIRTVTRDGFEPADPPHRFEAGTMPVAEAVGLQTAIEWLSQFSWDDRIAHEQSLLKHALEKLSTIKGLHILGPGDASEISCSISFVIDGIHPHDLTDILGQKGFALRAGHHCAQPLHERLGVPATARLSVGIYSTTDEIDALIPAIEEAKNVLL